MSGFSTKGWFRFSLWTLLVLVTGLSLWLGSQSYKARRQSAAVKELVGAGANVMLDDDPQWIANRPNNSQPWLSKSIRQFIGEDFFRSVKAVSFPVKYDRQSRTPNPTATEETLARLRGIPELDELQLGGNATVNDAALSHLRNLRNLEYLDLGHTSVRGAGLSKLVRLSELQLLALNNTPLEDEGLRHIGKLRSLTNLELSRTQITDAGVRHLSRLRKLFHLMMKGTNVTDAALPHLESLTRLFRLDLTHTNVTAQGVERLRQALPNCDIMVSFGLGEEPVDVEVFPAGHRPTADQVRARCYELGFDAYLSTIPWPGGETYTLLRLDRCTLSDSATLRLIANLPPLSSLEIRNGLVGDDFLDELASHHKLEMLSLGDTRITDAGMRHLSHMESLRNLTLRGSRITDAAVPYLAALKSLKFLIVSDTQMSDLGVQQLIRALPDCKVSFP